MMGEGGANVLQQLIDSGIWNEIRIETAPVTLGGGIKAPHVDMSGAKCQEIDNNTIFEIVNSVG